MGFQPHFKFSLPPKLKSGRLKCLNISLSLSVSLTLSFVAVLVILDFSAPRVTAQRMNFTALNFTSMAWLRICSGKERWLLTGGQCSGGYMFHKALPSPLCVCGNGVWVLKSGYCDSGPTFVLFAEGNTCFKVTHGIRWIRYMGHPEKAAMDGHFIVSQDWDYIEELDRTSPSRQILSKTVWTVTTGDQPANVYLPEELACYRSDWRPLGSNPIEDGRPFARVGRYDTEKMGAATLGEYPVPHQAQRLSYCPYFAREEHTMWISGGGMLVTDRRGVTYYPEPTEKVHGNCHRQCNNNPPEMEAVNRTKLFNPPENPNTFIPDYPWSDEQDSVVHQDETLEPIKSRTLEETLARVKAQAAGGHPGDDHTCDLKQDDFSREMDRQTVRMIRGQAAWALKQIKTPVVALREYVYLQKSRKIMQAKCPEVSPDLLKSFLRMFRYALNESLENHPYKVSGEEEHEHIMEALDQCHNFSDPNNTIEFVYNETMCPKELIRIQYKPVNETGGSGIFRNCSNTRPLSLKFDPCHHDLVLDVAWKVVLFTHYFCARHFNKYYKDVSYFYAAMEKLYNPDMMARYFNPGNSYRGMKFVFQMYDLETFVNNLDRCVSCSRDVSVFRRWLKRPKPLKMCQTSPSLKSRSGNFEFDVPGFTGFSKNPVTRPLHTMNHGLEYQCYESWTDGIYSVPQEPIKDSCGLGLHVVGETVTYA